MTCYLQAKRFRPDNSRMWSLSLHRTSLKICRSCSLYSPNRLWNICQPRTACTQY